MCWTLRVFWTVFQNLLIRTRDDISDACYYGCCAKTDHECSEVNNSSEDYIVVREPIYHIARCFNKSIETEHYFRAVDRLTAEDILRNRVDGSCIVRPYKEIDKIIKYIVSIYAKNNYFHLYIRNIDELGKYGIGLEKPFEKLFNSPKDIINYYRLNKLLCTNRSISVSLVLIPIT